MTAAKQTPEWLDDPALTDRVLAAIRRGAYDTRQQDQSRHEAMAAAALAVIREHAPRVVEADVARGLAVAQGLLEKVANYWDGRPLTHHGDHIHADLMGVLRAITPATTEGAPNA